MSAGPVESMASKCIDALLRAYPGQVVTIDDRASTWGAVLAYPMGASTFSATGSTIDAAVQNLWGQAFAAASQATAKAKAFEAKLVLGEEVAQ